MKLFRPVLSIAILITVIGGIYYLIADYKEESELLEKALLENKELNENSMP